MEKSEKNLTVVEKSDVSQTSDTTCSSCEQTFKTQRGRKIHEKACKKKKKIETDTISPADKTNLPKIWGHLTLPELMQTLSVIYKDMTKWRKNLFNLPSGASGKRFVEEITRLINEWNNMSPLSNIAMKALSVMPSLLLQKPSKTSKAKDHTKCLERRLILWEKGEFDSLLRETCSIQASLLRNSVKKETSLAKRFSDLMFLGKVNSALKLLSRESSTGVCTITDETLRILQEKHPQAQPKYEDLLLQGPVLEVHPSRYNAIDADLIMKTVARTKEQPVLHNSTRIRGNECFYPKVSVIVQMT